MNLTHDSVFWNWESHFTHYTRNGIVTRLRAGESGVLIFTETRNFSLLLEIHSGARVHPQRFFPESKAAGREVDLSLPSSAEVQNEWSYTSVCFFLFGSTAPSEPGPPH